MKILVGGILQEGNTFSPLVSTVDDYRKHFFIEKEELLEPMTVHNELLGFQQAIQEAGGTIVPTLFASAVSSGKLAGDAFEWFKKELKSHLAQVPSVDGVLFALHGAQVAEGCDDPEGELLALIRQHVGDSIPVVITLDSHANVTRHMVDQVNGLVGYRTFPHVDFVETGYRAAQLLFSILRGDIQPQITLRKVPMILPAENHQTHNGPMKELWDEAVAGEQQGESAFTSLFAVQPWLDVPEMGFSVVVVGDEADRNQREAERLARLAWAKRKQFDVTLYTVPQVLELLEAAGTRDPAPVPAPVPVPVVVSDSADSPGAGSPGDSNAVLRQLLEHGADRRWKCLLPMVDARAVAAMSQIQIGQDVTVRVGHSISTDTGTPLEIQGTLVRQGDGKFRFGDGFSANLIGNMGQYALIQIGTISLLLMERAVFTGDPAMYRSVDLEPTEAHLVLVKSANQFRAEYERITQSIYILDTPGASTANLQGLSFRRIPRPMYPWDDDIPVEQWGE